MLVTAALLRDNQGPFSIEEVELPALGPGEVLVEVAGAGYCHTDTLLRQFPNEMLPFIGGHEGAGVVQEVGAGVTGIAVGDHVVMSFDSCGSCRNCRLGLPPYCDEFTARNFMGHKLDGSAGATDASGAPVGWRWFGQSSFATHAVASIRNTVVVDRAVDLTLLGPLGCGIQTGAGSVLNALDVRPGSSLVVYGAGAVGLAAVMAAGIAGASKVIAVDRHQARLDLALSLGATDVIDAAAVDDLGGEVTTRTAGGSDFALDTTGVPAVVAAAVAGLRPTGVCGLVGVGFDDLGLNSVGMMGKTVKGIYEGDAVPQVFIPQMIEYWRGGRFPFDRLIGTFPLDAINEAEKASNDGVVVKPVLLPTRG